MQTIEKNQRLSLSGFAGPLVLLLITLGVFWKLILPHQYTWMDQPDTVNQILPWYQFQAAEWHQGRFPLWDPYHWGGQSLIGQAQPGAAYPFNWILFLLPLRDGFIRRSSMHWYFVMIHYMGALFCYWLCRDLKRSRTASLLAGAAFGLGGYMGTTDWPQMLNGAVWAPLILLFFLRAMRGHRPLASTALSGTFLGMAFLSGHHQIPMFTALAMAGLWLYYLYAAPLPRLRLAQLSVLFAVFFALVGALQTFPASEYWNLSLRWIGLQNPVSWNQPVPYIVHDRYSLEPISLLGIVIPNIYRDTNPFIGLVVVSLALIGVSIMWREKTVRVFFAVALGGLLFALGSSSVFHGVLYAIVPRLEKARTPAMAILFFHLGVAVLAAYGLDAYRKNPVQANDFSRRLIWAVAGFSGLGFALVLAFLSVRPATGGEYDRLALAAFTWLLLAVLLDAWRRARISSRAATSLAVLLLLFELGHMTGWNYRHREQGYLLPKMFDNMDIAQFLKQKKEPARAEIDGQEITFNFGDWQGVEQINGYAGVTTNVLRASYADSARKLLGVKFYVGRKPNRNDQREVYQGKSGLKVFENPGVFPRVWTVHEIMGVRNPEEGLVKLDDSSLDFHRQTFLVGTPPNLESCDGSDDVRLVDRTTNYLRIEVDMRCRGMAAVGDTFFPGWQASIDGRLAPIYEVYGFLRGVAVDSGRHQIEMHYRPKSVYLGATLTALGLSGAFLLCLFGKRLEEPVSR
ncbi:MAG: hypothetical protein HY236_00320 [Acidobacteria bacterium]|nr:hypothetical protein [Acidobacteriota bacterium]